MDIDNTICKTEGMDYKNAEPIHERIKYINELYDSGNCIVYWTSRGVGSGLDFRELTEQQLKDWKCRYDKLEMDKPIYDLFIDDKVKNASRIK